MTRPLILLVALAACGDGVPDKPTYFADVQPILRANCVRCHGADPSDPKIATFRLDRYVQNDDATFDVWDYANGDPAPIMTVAVNHESPAMPPDYSLTDRQRDVLARWMAQGAPKGSRTNHAPRIELVSPTGVATADQTIDTTFRAWDDDLDGLYVRLWARDLTDASEPPYSMGPRIGGGERTVSVDVGTLASTHDYEVYAVLDDGYFDDPAQNRTEATLIPVVHVDHGTRGTAPRVEVVSPNGGQTLIGTAAIEWTASDPDVGDSLTFNVELVRVAADGTTSVAASIAPDLQLPVPPSGTPYRISWDIPMSVAATDGTGTSIPYKIRVTARDLLGKPEPNVRSDDSDLPVFIAQANVTTYNWADARPIFEKYCKACHGAAGKTPAIDYFCVLKYNLADPDPACEASDQGAFETKGQIYQRMVQAKSMPPAGQAQPTQAEIDLIGSWILGGAPGGGVGPGDDPPTLSWDAPSASAIIDASGSGVAMLMWTVSDAQGLASDALESALLLGTGAASDCTTYTCPSMQGPWTPITGAGGTVTGMSASRSFAWNAPTTKQGPNTVVNHGCYCVRGTVKDTAGQSVPVTAAKSVKF